MTLTQQYRQRLLIAFAILVSFIGGFLIPIESAMAQEAGCGAGSIGNCTNLYISYDGCNYSCVCGQELRCCYYVQYSCTAPNNNIYFVKECGGGSCDPNRTVGP